MSATKPAHSNSVEIGARGLPSKYMYKELCLGRGKRRELLDMMPKLWLKGKMYG